MELFLTENGVERVSKPKLSELGRKEILEKSLKRVEKQPLKLIKNGNVKVIDLKFCKGCTNQIDYENPSEYCVHCINAIVARRNAEARRKDWKILFWVVSIAGLFVAILASTGKFLVR